MKKEMIKKKEGLLICMQYKMTLDGFYLLLFIKSKKDSKKLKKKHRNGDLAGLKIDFVHLFSLKFLEELKK